MTRYAFLEDARDPTLLFVCSREDASTFADWLHAIGRRLNAAVQLDESQGFEKRGNWAATFDLQVGTAGQATTDHETRTLTWKASPESVERAASLIQGILESDQPGHAYLEDSGDIVIKVSVDELSSPIWTEQLRALMCN